MDQYCYVNPSGGRANGLRAYIEYGIPALRQAGIYARSLDFDVSALGEGEAKQRTNSMSCCSRTKSSSSRTRALCSMRAEGLACGISACMARFRCWNISNIGRSTTAAGSWSCKRWIQPPPCPHRLGRVIASTCWRD